MSMTQICPLFKTSLTDSTLVPYRLPLYSPYSRNLNDIIRLFIKHAYISSTFCIITNLHFRISVDVKGSHLLETSRQYEYIVFKLLWRHVHLLLMASQQSTVPVVLNHVVEDFSADEMIFSAGLLVFSGCS